MFTRDPVALRALEAAATEYQRITASNFSKDAVLEAQNRKLEALWGRIDHVPHYQGLPGIASRRLQDVPTTPKDALKGDPAAFLWKAATVYHKYYESSGSTGRPTPTPRLVEDAVWNVAAVASMWSRILGPGDRVASLLPSDVAPVGDLAAGVTEYLGCTLLRCYPFSQGMCDWDRLENLFTGYRPERVFAAPGVVLQWTRILKERRQLKTVRESVGTILLLGEVSTRPLRARLAREWDADVIDASYGSTETGTIAAACEHDRLHVLLQGQLPEVIVGDEPRPLAPGMSGELVTTTLNNHARPLLRYATGDLIDVEDGAECACGVAAPVLSVRGRASDGIAVRGTSLSVAAVEKVVYGVEGVTGYLVQLRAADPDAARLVLERDIDFSGDTEELCARVREEFAAQGVHWSQVIAVGRLPALTKAGGSQKNWKRTNVQWVE